MDNRTEATPLLANETQPTEDGRNRTRWFQVSSPQAINALQSFVMFCITFSSLGTALPVTQLLQDALCREEYDSIPELGETTRCNTASIKTKLAWILSTTSVLSTVVELIVAIPFGALADRIGRRPVLVWATLSSMVGIVVFLGILQFPNIFPAYLVALSSLPRLFGGGETVLLAMLYSITSDTAPPELRANYFLQLSVGSFMGQSLGSLVASALMSRGHIWTPIILSFMVMPVGLSTILLYPEPKITKYETEDEINIDTSLKARLRKAAEVARSTFSIAKSPPVAIILFSFSLITPVSMCIATLLVLFVSLRFEWTIAQAGYLLSIRGFGDIFVFLLLIPAATKLLVSERFPFRCSTAQKDLILARISLLFVAVGIAIIAIPAIPAVVAGVIAVTFGFGWLAMCRSLIVLFIDESHVSQVYSLVGVVESLGTLIAEPGLAALYSAGLRLGASWQALPFMVVSMLCVVSASLLFLIRVPSRQSQTQP